MTDVQQGPAQPSTPRCIACSHPMGDHSVYQRPKATWCHACNAECGHIAAAPVVGEQPHA